MEDRVRIGLIHEDFGYKKCRRYKFEAVKEKDQDEMENKKVLSSFRLLYT